MNWISKPPGKLPPATNIVRTFDYYSWIMIGVSLLSVSLACRIASKVGQSYGVGTLDKVQIILFPLGTLNAEPLPRWFTKKKKRKSEHNTFFSPGFAGNGLLLMWTVMASFLSMAFLSNIRAMLMIPVHERPIDTTEDIFKQDKVPLINLEGSFWREYLLESSNPWERRAGGFGTAPVFPSPHFHFLSTSGEVGETSSTSRERTEAVVEKVEKAGTHVIFDNKEVAAWIIHTHPQLKNKAGANYG